MSGKPTILPALRKRLHTLEAELLEVQRDLAAEAGAAGPDDPLSVARDRAGWSALEARRAMSELDRAMGDKVSYSVTRKGEK